MAVIREEALTARQQQVLASVVEEHIRTTEPVGSRAVRERYNLQVSTATIRNDMVALERAGYIRQPHTSAGRVPRQKAYRFYVDQMLEQEVPLSREFAWMVGEFRRTRRNVETVLRATTRLLSRLTHQPALAGAPTEPAADITSIRSRPVSSTALRVEYTTSDGRSHELLLRCPQSLTAEQISQFDALLAQRLQGRQTDSVYDMTPVGLQMAVDDLQPMRILVEQLQAQVEASEQPVYVDGATQILQQPEFAEHDKLCPVMATLDEEPLLRRLLRSASQSNDVLVAIGTENKVSALRECSLVAKSYRVAPERVGSIAVVGPMRMPYRQIIAVVRSVAQRVGQLLREDNEPE